MKCIMLDENSQGDEQLNCTIILRCKGYDVCKFERKINIKADNKEDLVEQIKEHKKEYTLHSLYLSALMYRDGGDGGSGDGAGDNKLVDTTCKNYVQYYPSDNPEAEEILEEHKSEIKKDDEIDILNVLEFKEIPISEYIISKFDKNKCKFDINSRKELNLVNFSEDETYDKNKTRFKINSILEGIAKHKGIELEIDFIVGVVNMIKRTIMESIDDEEVEEYVYKSKQLFNNLKDITYDSIIGCEFPIQQLKDFHVDRRAMEKAGKPYLKGIFNYGPPRTGKGTTIKAMINMELNPETDVAIILDAEEIISHNLKESASNVKRIMNMAIKIRNKYKKSVHIVVDEAEKVVPGRNTTSHNQSVLASAWLKAIDGIVEDISCIYTYIVTNKPLCFDNALVAYERISVAIYYGLPDRRSRIKAFERHILPLLDDKIEMESIEDIAENTTGQTVAFFKHLGKIIDAKKEQGIKITKDFLYKKLEEEIERSNKLKNLTSDVIEEDEYVHEIEKLIVEFMKEKVEWVGEAKELRVCLVNVKMEKNPLFDATSFYSEKSIGHWIRNDSVKNNLEIKGIYIETWKSVRRMIRIKKDVSKYKDG